MEHREATASLLFAGAVLIALWTAGSTILFHEGLSAEEAVNSMDQVRTALKTLTGFVFFLSLLSVALTCALAEPCRKHALRTFIILAMCSLSVVVSVSTLL